MPTIVVLGAGLVGSVIASDLVESKGFRVSVVDRSADSLARAESRTGGRVKIVEGDCGDPKTLRAVTASADLVVGALPSTLGFRALTTMVEEGKRYCDISFMPEDYLELAPLAKKRGACCVVDCGVAPGMSNLLAAWGVARLDRAEHIDIMVGGIPRVRAWPFEYKAGFAPYDVLEEYVRPARVVEAGRVVVKPALSEIEPVEFEGLGTLEAFNTDGLRSLAYTLDVPFMRERTLRYPGHAQLMRALRETGLLSLEPVELGGISVKPRDLLAKLLFPKWTYADGEEDLTVMRVVVEGTMDRARTIFSWELFDRYDASTGYSSMSRTTAFPATSVGRMLLDGTIKEKGVLAPEQLSPLGPILERILKELRSRGVEYRAGVERLSDPAAKPTKPAGRRKSARTG